MVRHQPGRKSRHASTRYTRTALLQRHFTGSGFETRIVGSKLQSYSVFSSKLKCAGCREVPSTYFYNEKGMAVVIEGQKAMVEWSGVKLGGGGGGEV